LIRFRNWRIRRCSCTLGPKHGAQKRKPSTNSIDWNVAVKGHLHVRRKWCDFAFSLKKLVEIYGWKVYKALEMEQSIFINTKIDLERVPLIRLTKNYFKTKIMLF
jgi:hypothetical protein